MVVRGRPGRRHRLGPGVGPCGRVVRADPSRGRHLPRRRRRGDPAGGLRGLVADHLAGHPAEDFSSTQVANALGRSSGAVANALERLVQHGAAVQTSTAPRRYQHHTDPAHGNAQDGAGPDGMPEGTDLDQKAS